MNEYELAGIETIARGILVRDGKLLLCRAKGAGRTYLPGGHIEFGETGRAALAREMMEETGREVTVGNFRGCLETRFEQHGKPHAEINLVYEMALRGESDAVVAKEDWIEFEWRPLAELGEANLLPETFRALGENPAAVFAP